MTLDLHLGTGLGEPRAIVVEMLVLITGGLIMSFTMHARVVMERFHGSSCQLQLINIHFRFSMPESGTLVVKRFDVLDV